MKQFLKDFIIGLIIAYLFAAFAFAAASALLWLMKTKPVLAVTLIVPAGVIIALLLDKLIDALL